MISLISVTFTCGECVAVTGRCGFCSRWFCAHLLKRLASRRFCADCYPREAE